MTTTWTTKEGDPILLMDMGDDHLMNTIRMLERNAPLTEEVTIFQLRVFGIDIVIRKPPFHKVNHPMYPTLLQEAEDRELL